LFSADDAGLGEPVAANNYLAIGAQPGSAGDILVQGSQLKAGGDLGLDASRDILLQSAQNTQSNDSKNSSKGGSVGIGIGVGSGGYGISVSASVNAAKGSEKGNGLTHSETTLDAGNRLSLTSGRDITLTGAQASGESVKVDAGRNLTLTSEQDSDRYDSKQQSASAGGSFTFGSMTGSANVNVSRDKMHSTWQSVAEQTGIFAGKGGFDVTVGEHTQLNGAVISSTATADKNRLDTGTLGFGDIENHAEYDVQHQSAGMSTGGSIGGQFAGNMANGMLAGLNGSGSADSTTKAAVASYASGNNALAGAAGAVSGELMAKLVMNQLYPGKAVSDLTETEKQTISALGTLVAGLAGGMTGDSTADAVAGAQAGQNAVNNNLFGGTEAGQKKFVQKQGKDVMSCADDPSSVSCQRGEAVNKAIAGALATGGVASLTAPAQAMWALGAGVNAGAQYAEDGTVNPVNSVVAGWTNVITIGNGLTGTVIWNAVGGALTNQINGDDPLTGAITNGAGSALGYGAGKLISSGTNAAGKWITGGWDPKFNPDLLKYTEVKGQLGISKEMLPSKYPSAAGNVGASYVSEKSGNILQDQIKSNGDAN